jgi:hypothetical protein
MWRLGGSEVSLRLVSALGLGWAGWVAEISWQGAIQARVVKAKATHRLRAYIERFLDAR